MRIVLLSLITMNSFAQQVALKEDQLFNTAFLANYTQVAKWIVAEEEFEPVSFSSSDGIQLAGLARIKPNAPYSVVCCAGFLPGRKEGLATFIRLLPQEANILFFDARGHGQSSGRLWTNLHNYGLDEYKDVAAAIDYIKKNSTKETPIFLHGLCAGAYHAANTLMTMPKDEQIKGLIFDSGLTSPLNSMDIPGEYCKEKTAPALCAQLYRESKEKAKTRFLSKILGAIGAGFFRLLGICVYPFLKQKAAQLDLLTKAQIRSIEYPVLFIHAESDKFAKIDPVKKLAESVKEHDEWWIPDAQKKEDPRPEHALNQIKCKHEYLARLRAFIDKQLKKYRNEI